MEPLTRCDPLVAVRARQAAARDRCEGMSMRPSLTASVLMCSVTYSEVPMTGMKGRRRLLCVDHLSLASIPQCGRHVHLIRYSSYGFLLICRGLVVNVREGVQDLEHRDRSHTLTKTIGCSSVTSSQ